MMVMKMNKDLSLNESIIKIRVDLQNLKIKKSGKNKFAGFDYYELSDFLPKLNELMLQYGVNDKFTIEEEKATLTLIKGNETQTYSMPFKIFDTPINKKYNKDLDEYIEVKSMQDIQYLGALNTYYKRYLYLNAFGITDGEIIDGMNNDDLDKKTTDFRTLLMNELKKQGININEYAKEHGLNAKTTQQQAKELLEKLIYKNEEVVNENK